MAQMALGIHLKNPPYSPYRYLSRWQAPAHASPRLRLPMLERTIQLLPVSNMILSKYDDHCLVACNQHEADSSSKIVM